MQVFLSSHNNGNNVYVGGGVGEIIYQWGSKNIIIFDFPSNYASLTCYFSFEVDFYVRKICFHTIMMPFNSIYSICAHKTRSTCIDF